MNLKNVGEKIRLERKVQGLTIKNFAKLIGASTTTVQRIETGAKSPSIDILAEISAVFRKPIDDFIQEEKKSFYKIDSKRQKEIHQKNSDIKEKI